jgi:hypothetical protein
MNSDGTSDPYVELSAFGVVGSESLGEVHRKSKMRSKTVDPVWDEVLEFETTDLRRTLEQPLRLQVVNHHRLRKGNDLGTAKLDLRVLASYCPEALPHSVAHVPHTEVAGETLYEGWYASFERVPLHWPGGGGQGVITCLVQMLPEGLGAQLGGHRALDAARKQLDKAQRPLKRVEFHSAADNALPEVAQAWRVQHRDGAIARSNLETLRAVAAVLKEHPSYWCRVHYETAVAKRGPARLADALARQGCRQIDLERDAEMLMDYLAEQRALSIVESLVDLGVDAAQMYATYKGQGDGEGARFALQAEPPPTAGAEERPLSDPPPERRASASAAAGAATEGGARPSKDEVLLDEAIRYGAAKMNTSRADQIGLGGCISAAATELPNLGRGVSVPGTGPAGGPPAFEMEAVAGAGGHSATEAAASTALEAAQVRAGERPTTEQRVVVAVAASAAPKAEAKVVGWKWDGRWTKAQDKALFVLQRFARMRYNLRQSSVLKRNQRAAKAAALVHSRKVPGFGSAAQLSVSAMVGASLSRAHEVQQRVEELLRPPSPVRRQLEAQSAAVVAIQSGMRRALTRRHTGLGPRGLGSVVLGAREQWLGARGTKGAQDASTDSVAAWRAWLADERCQAAARAVLSANRQAVGYVDGDDTTAVNVRFSLALPALPVAAAYRLERIEVAICEEVASLLCLDRRRLHARCEEGATIVPPPPLQAARRHTLIIVTMSIRAATKAAATKDAAINDAAIKDAAIKAAATKTAATELSPILSAHLLAALVEDGSSPLHSGRWLSHVIERRGLAIERPAARTDIGVMRAFERLRPHSGLDARRSGGLGGVLYGTTAHEEERRHGRLGNRPFEVHAQQMAGCAGGALLAAGRVASDTGRVASDELRQSSRERLVRAAAMRHALTRSFPDAPPWLRLAIDLTEESGAFIIDGAQGGAPHSTELAPAVWLAMALGAASGVHTVALPRIGLERVPPPLGAVRSLRHLDLSGNALASLPDELRALAALRYADLSRNRLAAVPACVWAWPRLSALSLAHNSLEALPEAIIGSTAVLAELDLSFNLLGALPEAFGALHALVTLDASHNNLTAVPSPLLDLEARSLTSLHLGKNAVPAPVLLLEGRVRGGCYVAVEFCVAARPSVSLNGDTSKYLACFGGVCRLVAMLTDGAIPVLPNPSAADTVAPASGEAAAAVTDEGGRGRYPRLGAFEVVLRTRGGLYLPLYSKLATRAFPSVEALARTLLKALGQPPEEVVLLHDTQHLHRAASAGALPPLRRLMAVAGADLHARDAEGATPLHAACSHGQVGAAELLLRARASGHAPDAHGLTPLLAAAAGGHAACVELLLRVGARTGAVDATRASALHLAVTAGSLSCVELLLAAGAEPGPIDALGRTPAALAESLPEPLGSQLRQLFERAQVIDRLALDAATRAAERTQRASLVHSHQVLADGTAGARGSGGMGADNFL